MLTIYLDINVWLFVVLYLNTVIRHGSTIIEYCEASKCCLKKKFWLAKIIKRTFPNKKKERVIIQTNSIQSIISPRNLMLQCLVGTILKKLKKQNNVRSVLFFVFVSTSRKKSRKEKIILGFDKIIQRKKKNN